MLARLITGLLGLALILIAALMLIGGSSAYTLHARFLDAGQLVSGDRVEVGGVPIGTVSSLDLTRDGQADVTLSITDHDYTPLHAGTRALIRAPGLAGVADRYVALEPAPQNRPALASGATLGTQSSTGIVDIDELLDSETPQVRDDMRAVFAHGAEIFAGSGAHYFNQLLASLSPGLAQTSGLFSQLAQDRAGLSRLVSTGDRAAQVLAAQPTTLQDDVSHLATVLNNLAAEQRPLADVLSRSPGVLADANHTLTELGPTVKALSPALVAVPPAARPLSAVLAGVVRVGPKADPVIRRLTAQLPNLDRATAGLAPLGSAGKRTLADTTKALSDSQTMLTGLRYYAPDFLLGVTNGLGGLAGANYDVNGHYARVEFVNAPQTAASGVLTPLIPQSTLIPGQFGVREHLTARCPGGDAPPAPDGSNPWTGLDPFWCNPADDIPLSVDTP